MTGDPEPLSTVKREEIRALMQRLMKDKPPYPDDFLVAPDDSDEVARAKMKAQCADPNSPISIFAAAAAKGAQAEFAAHRRWRFYLAAILFVLVVAGSVWYYEVGL